MLEKRCLNDLNVANKFQTQFQDHGHGSLRMNLIIQMSALKFIFKGEHEFHILYKSKNESLSINI